MKKTKSLCLVALFVTLTCVGAFIRVPFFIPFTLQTLVAMLAGLLLGKKHGTLSQVLYVCFGLLGLPIFTKGGGIWYFTEITFGYILTLPLTAFFCAFMAEKIKSKNFWKLFTSVGITSLASLLFGLCYLLMIMSLTVGEFNVGKMILTVGLQFVPIELAKAFVAVMIFLKMPKQLTE